MQTCYVDRATNSIADLVCPGELTTGWTITRINVPFKHRGNGVARKLLKQITDDADSDICSLWLEVSPSDGLDYDQLVAWYVRHGFRFRHGGYMVRIPKDSEAE